MSDLQIGLGVLGLFVIGGVVAFNWFQEKQFRQRVEHGFTRPEADALLEKSSRRRSEPVDDLEQRIDPRLGLNLEDELPAQVRQEEGVGSTDSDAAEFGSDDDMTEDVAQTVEVQSAVEDDNVVVTQASASTGAAAVPDSTISYVAEIRAGEVVPATAINGLEHALKETGRKYRLYGFDYNKRSWEPINDPENWFTSVRVYIQLVDRGGPIKGEQLEEIAGLIWQHAQTISGICEAPDVNEAISRAMSLDSFCVDVDVIIGLSVVARPGQVLHGTQIRALAEANGLKLGASGVFTLHDTQGHALFTMDNQESNQFRADNLKNLTTRGVTFLLDVPRTANGIKVFNKMVSVGKQFAESLDAVLCDDNRVMINDSGLEKIRNQLRGIYDTMQQRGISAGGDTARQLFS